jgi:hypothetical protein
MRHFLDLPVALGGLPPGADWLLAAQRRRLRSGRPPGPDSDAALLLARRDGRPVGRLTAHVSGPGHAASFGFLSVEGPDDVDVVRALVAAAARWAAARDRTTLVGPLSWGPDEEAGLLVVGHDQVPVTGRAWTPPWYADLVAAAGLEELEEQGSYRLPAGGTAPDSDLQPGASLAVPGELTPYVDPILLLTRPDGSAAIVAVPDVAGTWSGWAGRTGGAGTGGRSLARGAWSLAHRARKKAWDGCVVLALDGPEEVLIPTLCAVAGQAGYRWVLSPWAPNGTAPVMVHRLYTALVADLQGRLG